MHTTDIDMVAACEPPEALPELNSGGCTTVYYCGTAVAALLAQHLC